MSHIQSADIYTVGAAMPSLSGICPHWEGSTALPVSGSGIRGEPGVTAQPEASVPLVLTMELLAMESTGNAAQGPSTAARMEGTWGFGTV